MNRGRPSIKKTIKKPKSATKKEESLGSYGERSTLWKFLSKGKNQEWIVKNPPPVKTADDLNRENIKKLFYKSGAEHAIVKEKKIYIDCEKTPPSEPTQAEQKPEREDHVKDAESAAESMAEMESSSDAEEAHEEIEEKSSSSDSLGKEEKVEDDDMDESDQSIEKEHNHLNEKMISSKDTLMDELSILSRRIERDNPDYDTWNWCISEHLIEERFSFERNETFYPSNPHTVEEYPSAVPTREEERREEEEKKTSSEKIETKLSSQEYKLPIAEEVSNEENPFDMEIGLFQKVETIETAHSVEKNETVQHNEMSQNNEPLQENDAWFEDNLMPVQDILSQDHLEPALEMDHFVENRCIICKMDIGPFNPRQYCGKTYCLYENVL